MSMSECHPHALIAKPDWTRPILVTGSPGTGKTQTVFAAIERCIAEERQALLTAPTGFLASKYREAFQDEAGSDTVHAAFKFPVCENDKPIINWLVPQYDILVVDEISMITPIIFHHVLKTLQNLPKRPVLLVSGDSAQQQPIVTIRGRTHATKSILANAGFLAMARHYNLTRQFRCIDPLLQRILDHVRYWELTVQVLSDLQNGRLLSTAEIPSDTEVISAILTHPQHTFLTISRKATNRVNLLVLSLCFNDILPLATIQYDCDLPEMPVYANMRVMITQNRDKKQNVVNGQLATVVLVRNKTIFLKLPNGKVVNTYPVTYKNPSGIIRTVYPFYARVCAHNMQSTRPDIEQCDCMVRCSYCSYSNRVRSYIKS